MTRFTQKIRLHPRLLLLLYLLVIYVDLFVVSIGLFIIYPDSQHPTALALLPPLVFLPIVSMILFKQLPALKDRNLVKVYRTGLLLSSLSLIAFLAYSDWILSRINPDNFAGLVTKWDAVYFTITTMATVGYGDIHPRSQSAHIWVTAQIIIGFAFIGFVIQKEMMAGRSDRDRTDDKNDKEEDE